MLLKFVIMRLFHVRGVSYFSFSFGDNSFRRLIDIEDHILGQQM